MNVGVHITIDDIPDEVEGEKTVLLTVPNAVALYRYLEVVLGRSLLDVEDE